MCGMLRSVGMFVVLGSLNVWIGACGGGAKSPIPIAPEGVKEIISDLQPWVNAEQLPRDERKSFEEFCRFLAVRRHCDDAINTGEMSDKEAVQKTQPLIDHLAKLGKPTEDILIRLLEARKGLDQQQRRQTLCKEDPEIYATIVLWTMASARAVPVLMELAKDERIENRAVFIRGLGRIGDPKALDFLKELAAADNEPEIQTEAKTAIEEIQKQAPPEKK